jgi:hypothetical protein
MARRHFRNQSADERRGLRRSRVAPLCTLARAIGDRYRRSAGPWVRPASAILRHQAAPFVFNRHVRVAAPIRVVHHDTVRTVTTRSPHSLPASSTVLTRAIARSARVEPAWPGQRVDPRLAALSPAPRASDASPPAPMVLPVQMVVARASAAPSKDADASGRPSPDRGDAGEWFTSAARVRPTAQSLGPAPLDMLDMDHVTRLTDRVVAAIDRRLLASRERVRA